MRMMHCRSAQRRVSRTLLAVWLLLGGLALVEQAGLVPETALYDEQALTGLELALKPDLGGADQTDLLWMLVPHGVPEPCGTGWSGDRRSSCEVFPFAHPSLAHRSPALISLRI